MPIAVVTAVIVKDGKVLMCQRHRDKLYPFHWEFPGGKVEAEETLFHALQRELWEELQITISDASIWFEDTMTYENDITYRVTFFIVKSYIGEIVNTEFEQIQWFYVRELETLTHLTGNANILWKIKAEGLPK